MNVTTQRIAALMAERGWTQVQLSKVSAVAYGTIYNVLNRDSKPRPSIIGRIASALGVTPEYLLGTSDKRGEPPVDTKSGADFSDAASAPMLVKGLKTQVEPSDIRQAIQVIARQLHLPEQRVADHVASLVRDCVKRG